MNLIARIPLAFWTGGGGFLVYAAWVLFKPAWTQRRTRHWPTTIGHVTRAEVKRSSGLAVDVWRVKLTYTYAVNGNKYVGHHRVTRPASAAVEPAAAMQARTVTVHVKPNSPANSLLWESEVDV